MDWRAAVGGKGEMWDAIGKLQFDFLVSQGLEPHHKLLDVGCGSLRGGIHFIPYLEKHNYFGIDQNMDLVVAGIDNELPPAEYYAKVPSFIKSDRFEFHLFHVQFDFILAQSLFPHLEIVQIVQCLRSAYYALKDDGRFFATFFEIPSGYISVSETHPSGITTFLDKDPFHESFNILEGIANAVGLKSKYIGDWGHPAGQKMVMFYK